MFPSPLEMLLWQKKEVCHPEEWRCIERKISGLVNRKGQGWC
jgi:hypothetical protein